MRCVEPGEVYLWVTVDSEEPLLTATSQEVNVHQADRAALDVNILSPDDWTKIATSQEFAVTATVRNNGSIPAEDVVVEIDQEYFSGCGYLLDILDEPVIFIPSMAPGEIRTFTWTLHGKQTCDTQCDKETTHIGVSAEASNADGDGEDIHIVVYPAAHLIAEIVDISPATTISVCDEFEVTYRVYNTGEADAWEASATLSVEPAGSVRIAEGMGGYTQYMGTIAGWQTGDYYEGTFTLHCKEECESTLTITPAGFDECGYYYCNCVPEAPYGECWELCNQEGRPIESRWIEPASQTVKQLASGGLDLEITKSVCTAYPEVDDTVTFTIGVNNMGPTDASGVEVYDMLDAALTFDSAEATQGSYDDGTGVWTVGSIAAGASAELKIMAIVDSSSEITNTAMLHAVDQPDGDMDNNWAMVTLNMEAVDSVDIALDAGWNLISLPLIPDDSDIEVVLDDIMSNVDTVWGYDAATMTWTSYTPGPAFDDLTDMVDGMGYWILMTAPDTLTVSGVVALDPPNTPPTYDVVTGWNLIGFKSTSAMAAGDYLAGIAGGYVKIWGFSNGMYSGVQSVDMMMPGMGYWVAVTVAGTIYP
jgi:uncharacterized repeat protein (TIGR01451 family)